MDNDAASRVSSPGLLDSDQEVANVLAQGITQDLQEHFFFNENIKYVCKTAC